MIQKTFNIRELALCASPFLFKRGIEVVAAACVTAVVGAAVANSTNKHNEANIQSTNATNQQIAQDTNETNKELVQQQNEYNSIGAQIQRGREAGVNPNTILGGSVSGNLQTEVPKMIAPIMQAFDKYRSPMSDFSQHFQQINDAVANIQKTQSEVKNIDYDSEFKRINNNWQDFMKSLDYSNKYWSTEQIKEGIRLWQAKSSESWQNVTLMRQTGRYIQALGASVNADNYDKFMRNVFSFDLYRYGVEHLKSNVFNNIAQGNQAEIMAKISMSMLPANLGLVRAQTYMYTNQGDYFKDLSSLTPANRYMLNSLGALYDSQTFGNFLDNSFKIDSYDFRLQFEKHKPLNLKANTFNQLHQGLMFDSQRGLNKEVSKRYEWQNSATYRFLEANEMFSKSMMMYGSAYSDFTGGTGLGSLLKKAPKIGF